MDSRKNERFQAAARVQAAWRMPDIFITQFGFLNIE
jgi:hypothetical protein